jgi:malonyl-CoA O-methyltransferase
MNSSRAFASFCMTKPSKARIRLSFERAAPSYDQAATVQRRICESLFSQLSPSQPPQRLLDAGCGTGYGLALLKTQFPLAETLGLDLSPAMLKRTPQGTLNLGGDLEHLPLADDSIDLYWSSLAVQWCDLGKALHEARRVLRSNGTLAIASLGPATFSELRLAFSGIDNHQHTLEFHAPGEISTLARQAGFATVHLQKSTETAYYADFKTLLRAVKSVGANQLGSGRRTSLLSRNAFEKAANAYEASRSPAGLPLTYDVITLIAQK